MFYNHSKRKSFKYGNLLFIYSYKEGNFRTIYYDAVLQQDFLIFKVNSRLKEIFIFSDLLEVSILDENDFTYAFDFSNFDYPKLIQKIDRNGHFLIDSGEEVIDLD